MNFHRDLKSLLLVALTCTVFAAHSWSSERGGAAAVDAQWKRAVEAGDVDGVVACYADDATLWMPDAAEAHGRDAIRSFYAGLLGSNTVSGVAYANAHYCDGGRFQAGAGEFTLRLTPRTGGAPETLSGRFSTIVERRNGRWVYTVDHASATPAAR